MRLNHKQKKFLNTIESKGRLLDDDEAFDFYIDNIMNTKVTCKLNNYRRSKDNKPIYDDYPLWELESKARQWHKLTIGSLVLQGILKVSLLGFEKWTQ